MKVKIEFEVNADFNKAIKLIYDRVDCLYYELLDIDDNFKNISVEIRTHENKCMDEYPTLKLHNSNSHIRHFYNFISKELNLDEEPCPMYHNGTCWGTKDKEKCTCHGVKQFCTHYPKGE